MMTSFVSSERNPQERSAGSSMESAGSFRGPIAWMARNPVAANLLMWTFLLGGFLMWPRIRKEVFPVVDLNMVNIQVVYPGATPEEVEQGIVLAIEQAIRGLDGIDRITSTASEGVGMVNVELGLGVNPDRVLQDIKSAVDRIVTFPESAERPVVSLVVPRREVISLILHGDVDEPVLRTLAYRVQDELEADPRITLVSLVGLRAVEISVEVPEERRRALGLTLEQIAAIIGREALEAGGGALRTSSGEILLRTNERRYFGRELYDIPIVRQPDGTVVRLGEIATIRDTVAETDDELLFNGQRALRLVVYSVGTESPNDVAAAVRQHAERLQRTLPPTVHATIWGDRSELYRDRTRLLLQNGLQGLVLVLLTLGLFLEVRLAFWVMWGIPMSFLGCLLLLPWTDVSINMISLFAFIITLGIVVDDAIVVGESVYYERSRGRSLLEAAIVGTQVVAVPVIFSVLTNILAFVPLFFVPGTMGQLWRNIPLIVTVVFTVSLIECLFILPSHLAHSRLNGGRGLRWLERPQEWFGRAFERWTEAGFLRFVHWSLQHRWIVTALSIGALIVGGAWVFSGRLGFSFLPKVEGDIVTALVVLPYGVPVEQTREVVRRIQAAAMEEITLRGGPKVLRGVLTAIGSSGGEVRGYSAPSARGSQGHLGSVVVNLVPADERTFSAQQFAEAWRQRVGELPGVESLRFQFTIGPIRRAIDVAISHRDPAVIEEACQRVAEVLRGMAGVVEVDDGVELGKPELTIRLTDAGRSAGLTAADVARQIRHAFFGAEALRQQRGRDEVRVYVRRPLEERQLEASIEQFVLKTPRGGEIPLHEAATVTRSRSYQVIRRLDGRRVMDVTADVLTDVTDAPKVLAALKEGILAKLTHEIPTLMWSFEGEQRDQREALANVGPGFVLVLLGLFATLAVPFRSYRQAILIMVTIPFGALGAVVGHVLMGYQLSFVSLMGMMALAGVVINDSILLTDTANQYRAAGASLFIALRDASVRRLRPVVLTSLTTFFGLMPMIFERSVQARFMIPMAISLGFGILFSTGVSLVVVPALTLVVEDIARALRWWFGWEPSLGRLAANR